MPTPKFKPGQSGNLKGRPKDKTLATQLRKAIVDDMPDIVSKLVELAKGGDMQAAKLLLDRVCPTLKPQAMLETMKIDRENAVRAHIPDNVDFDKSVIDVFYRS